MSGTIAFLFVFAYVTCFLLLPRGYWTYVGALVSLAIVHMLASIKYWIKIRRFRLDAITSLKEWSLTRDLGNDVNDHLKENYQFYRDVMGNRQRLLVGVMVCCGFVVLLLIPLFLSGRMDPSTNWMVVVIVVGMAIWTMGSIVYNIAHGLNPGDRKEFERTGNKFYEDLENGSFKIAIEGRRERK